MGFLRPELLWGLAAVAVPIVIHLLGRRRVRTVPIATLRFLEKARARASARWKLRRILLLAARAAALASLALLFAGPGCEGGASSSGPTSWLLLLDTSPSMAASGGGEPCLERARAALLRIVDRADRKDRFLFATTRSEGDGWGRGFSGDWGSVRSRLREAQVEYGEHRVDRALERAFRLLDGVEGARVVLATDLQASSWGQEGQGAGGVVPGSGKVPLSVVDVGLPNPANTWVESVSEVADGLRVGLGSQGPADAARRTVRVRLGETAPVNAFVSGAEAAFQLRLPAGPYDGDVQVSPGGDLALDDRTAFAGTGSARVRALFVNGDPRGFEIRDELFFVRRALAPGGRLAQAIEAREVRAGDLTAKDVEGVQVALLANTGPLPEAVASALRARVEAGAGVLVTLGDRWKPGPAPAGGGLSPLLAGDLRDVIAVPSNDPNRRPFEPIDPDSYAGPMALFRDRAAGDLGRAGVWTYWALSSRAGEPSSVWLRLENGAPLLAERRLGLGRSLTLATTLDRDGSDLCLQPAFLPWLERVLLHAAGRLGPRMGAWVTAGVPVALPYDGPVTVEGGRGEPAAWRPGFAPFVAPEPGAYRVRAGADVIDAFAARIDPRESDLTRLSAEALEQRLGKGSFALGESPEASASGKAGRRDVSGTVAAALLGLIALETALSARWYRRARPVTGEEEG